MLRRNPTYSPALRQLAALRVYAFQRGVDPDGLQAAAGLYRQALVEEPTDHTARAELADLLQLLRRNSEAEREYDAVLGSRPDDPDALRGYANLLTHVKGQTEEGDRMAKRAEEAAKRQEELEKTARVTGGPYKHVRVELRQPGAKTTVDYVPVGHPSHIRPREKRGASAAPAGWPGPGGEGPRPPEPDLDMPVEGGGRSDPIEVQDSGSDDPDFAPGPQDHEESSA